ncbi:MAG: hypothetical protein KJO65_07910, partial [Gemmatimonadetes bacterium]|nr:hypothetical protein [Gemmatimonadota bacterium]
MTQPDPSHRSGRSRWRGFIVLGLGVLVSLGAMVLTRYPGIVERTYAAEVGPRIARGLSLLTGWAPFSVAMLLAFALATGLVFRWVLVAFRLRGRG